MPNSSCVSCCKKMLITIVYKVNKVKDLSSQVYFCSPKLHICFRWLYNILHTVWHFQPSLDPWFVCSKTQKKTFTRTSSGNRAALFLFQHLMGKRDGGRERKTREDVQTSSLIHILPTKSPKAKQSQQRVFSLSNQTVSFGTLLIN